MASMPLDLVLKFVPILYNRGAAGREFSDSRETLVPAVAAAGVVARGFGLIIGVSEGCGGGVARWRSSLRTYTPAAVSHADTRVLRDFLTFSDDQLILGARRI